MDKEAFNPFQAYHKYVGREPVLDTAVGGGVGTAAGYYGANYLLNPLISLIAGMTNADPEKVRKVQQALKSYGGIAGGLAGLMYGAQKHLDTGSGIKGALGSMTDADYWEKNPAATSRYLNKHLEALQTGKRSIKTPNIIKLIRDTVGVPTSRDVEVMNLQDRELLRMQKKRMLEQAREGIEGINKTQSETDALAGQGFLPMDYAMSVIVRDPFLSMGQKAVTTGILATSGEDPTDAGGIMQSALRFGAGAVPAYLFGRGVANVMGLPPSQVQTLSNVGAVATGILNTGIFGD